MLVQAAPAETMLMSYVGLLRSGHIQFAQTPPTVPDAQGGASRGLHCDINFDDMPSFARVRTTMTINYLVHEAASFHFSTAKHTR